MPEIMIRIGAGVGGSNRTEKIKVNFADDPSVEQLIQHISQYYNEDLSEANVLVVVNGRVIQADEYQNYLVRNGDVVSIFRAVAGG